MLTGNRGEWSEAYALLKLLGDKNVFIGDKDLNKIPDLLYPIIKIIRTENDDSFEYHTGETIRVLKNSEELLSIPVQEFKEKAQFLLEKIKTSHDTTFAVPEIESFLNKIHYRTLKAKSSVKTDIRIVVHDIKTGLETNLGFSIKSQLGSPASLLNASKTTNFIYSINGYLPDHERQAINAIKSTGKIKARISALTNRGLSLSFLRTEKTIFNNNLVLIDSSLPKILAEIVTIFYSTDLSKTSDIVTQLAKDNPLAFNNEHNHPYYKYKIKKLLTEVAIGMMPATAWNGTCDTTGGYLIVKDSGEILAYHLYNRKKFEDYLFYNTKLDTASSSRHAFGKIYQSRGKTLFKLNLQIRFLK